MISFFRRKDMNTQEYEDLLKRLVKLEARMDYVEANEDNMRNLARKIQKQRKPVEEAESEDLKPNVFVPV